MKIEISTAELIELMQMKKDFRFNDNFKFDYQSFEDALVKGLRKESEGNYGKAD